MRLHVILNMQKYNPKKKILPESTSIFKSKHSFLSFELEEIIVESCKISFVTGSNMRVTAISMLFDNCKENELNAQLSLSADKVLFGC